MSTKQKSSYNETSKFNFFITEETFKKRKKDWRKILREFAKSASIAIHR